MSRNGWNHGKGGQPGDVAAGALVLVIGAGFWVYQQVRKWRNCSVCESAFTINKPCLHCGQPVCGSCGVEMTSTGYEELGVPTEGRVCQNHQEPWKNGLRNKLNEFRRQRQAVAEEEARRKEMEERHQARVRQVEPQVGQVELFSARYKGDVRVRLNKHVETNVHDSLDDAEHELKILALLEGCYTVADVQQERGSRLDGSYTRATFKLRGRI